MNTSYLIYDTRDGRISRRIMCAPDQIEPQLAAGEAYLEGDQRDDQFYVDMASRSVRPKRDFSLSALPLPCTLTIEGQQYRCATQPELMFDIPGTYRIAVDAGPQFKQKVFDYAYPPPGR